MHLPFDRAVAPGLYDRRGDSGIVTLNACGKGFHVGDSRARALLQPGVERVSVLVSKRLAELLCE